MSTVGTGGIISIHPSSRAVTWIRKRQQSLHQHRGEFQSEFQILVTYPFKTPIQHLKINTKILQFDKIVTLTQTMDTSVFRDPTVSWNALVLLGSWSNHSY